MNINKWSGITCDLSLTSLAEGIRQAKQRLRINDDTFILVNPEHEWVLDIHKFRNKGDLASKYPIELWNIPFMFSKCISKESFVIVNSDGIFLGSESIE